MLDFLVVYGCQPKNNGYPKMDGENKEKPELKMDDLGGPPLFFGLTPI